MSAPNFMVIHPITVKTFKFGSMWRKNVQSVMVMKIWYYGFKEKQLFMSFL